MNFLIPSLRACIKGTLCSLFFESCPFADRNQLLGGVRLLSGTEAYTPSACFHFRGMLLSSLSFLAEFAPGVLEKMYLYSPLPHPAGIFSGSKRRAQAHTAAHGAHGGPICQDHLLTKLRQNSAL